MMKTTDIVPFSLVRKNMRASIEQVKTSGRPMVITTDGHADAVLMSAQEYDGLMEELELLKSADIVRESIRQFQEGKSISADEAFKRIKHKIKAAGESCDTKSISQKSPAMRSKLAMTTSKQKARRTALKTG